MQVSSLVYVVRSTRHELSGWGMAGEAGTDATRVEPPGRMGSTRATIRSQTRRCTDENFEASEKKTMCIR